jgi:cell wall-associated NlpC family hydrolase
VRTARKTSLVRTTVATGAALVTGLVVLPSSGYATPDPSIEDVQRRAHRLFEQAEQAQERLNTIKVDLKDARKNLKTLRADVNAQERTLEAASERVGDMVAFQAQQSPMGLTSQLLASGNPDDFIDGLAAMQSYSSTQASLMAGYEAASAELDLRKQQLAQQVDAIAKAKDQAAKEYQTVDEKADKAQALLDELQAEQAAEASRDQPEAPSTTIQASSGQAQIAVDYALAQVGDAYVYGAAGPDSYDCSGLTMAAWAQAGVSLSHSSSVQATQGTAISLSQAVPGDLLFYYSPISHVGIYIGNGQIVHAANPSTGVEVAPATGYMPLTSVRHIG